MYSFPQLLPIRGATVGAAITTGVPQSIQSIGVDRISGVWVTGYSLTGLSQDVLTPTLGHIPYAKGTAATFATQVVARHLPASILVGMPYALCPLPKLCVYVLVPCIRSNVL